MRKITRKGLIKKLDKYCAWLVIKKYKGKCVTCGSTNRPTWSHVFSRRTYSTRWDLMNCHCQCWPCNFKHVRDQYPYFKWFEDKYGKKELEALRKRFKTTRPWKMYDLQDKLDELEMKSASYISGLPFCAMMGCD